MGFKLSMEQIKELIKKGYLDEAFSELMNNRMKWNKWGKGFRSKYMIDQLGIENICKLYEAIKYPVHGALFDKRSLSKRRVEVLEDAYELYCKE